MEHLTTGRRHIRAGSVHVTELIGRRSRPVDIWGPLPADVEYPPLDDEELASLLDLASPNSHRRPPSTVAQVAKIAGLSVASLALCAAIVTASVIADARHHSAGTAVAARPPVDITGGEALLPDLLDRTMPGSTTASPLPAPAEATGTIENPAPAAARPAPPVTAPTPARTPVARPIEPLSRKELVEQFYRLAATSPDQAFGLLDDTLLGTDLGEFVRSWSGVRDVEVLTVREQGNDVVAVVRMLLPDGSHLRVQQLLNVTGANPPRISGAQILSAQRN